MSLQIRSQRINRTWEVVRYRMNDDEVRGFEDLLRYYSPIGVVRKVLTYFGAGGTVPASIGHGWYFDFDYVVRRITGLTGLATGVKRTIYGGGKGHSLFNMFASSLGELIERVLGSLEYMEKANDCIFGTYADLSKEGANCIHPDELPLFSPNQYEEPDNLFDPFTEESYLGWVEGKRLFSEESIWLPAQIALLYYMPREEETIIGFGTTGGLACHINRLESLFHGVVELFERDAMNVAWVSWIKPEIIEMDRPTRGRELQKLLDISSAIPGEAKFYLHTLDTPELPVVTCIEIDPWLNHYCYYSGAGADPDIDSALVGSFTEYGQAERNMRLALAVPQWRFARGVERLFDVDPDVDMRELNIFFKIVPYYGHKQNVGRLSWYTETEKRVPLSSLPTLEDTSIENRWSLLVEMLHRLRIDPIVFDFTPKQMESARLTKVFIPELTQPFPPAWPLLGHPRYYELPQQLGLTDRRLTFEELNKDPLPYP